MSATAFQRMRREALEKEEVKEESTLTVKEIKALLVEKGIEFDAKAKKEELIKILEGAE